jgi:hypothetical protein
MESSPTKTVAVYGYGSGTFIPVDKLLIEIKNNDFKLRSGEPVSLIWVGGEWRILDA